MSDAPAPDEEVAATVAEDTALPAEDGNPIDEALLSGRSTSSRRRISAPIRQPEDDNTTDVEARRSSTVELFPFYSRILVLRWRPASRQLEVEFNEVKYMVPRRWEEVPDSFKKALKRGGNPFLWVMGFYAIFGLYYMLLVWTVEWCRPVGFGCDFLLFGVHLHFVFAASGSLCITFLSYKYHELKIAEREREIAASDAAAARDAVGSSSAAAGSDAESEDDYMEDEFGICIEGQPKLDLPLQIYGAFLGLTVIWMILAINPGWNELNPGYVRARKFFSLYPLLLLPIYGIWFKKDAPFCIDPLARVLQQDSDTSRQLMRLMWLVGLADPTLVAPDAEVPLSDEDIALSTPFARFLYGLNDLLSRLTGQRREASPVAGDPAPTASGELQQSGVDDAGRVGDDQPPPPTAPDDDGPPPDDALMEAQDGDGAPADPEALTVVQGEDGTPADPEADEPEAY